MGAEVVECMYLVVEAHDHEILAAERDALRVFRKLMGEEDWMPEMPKRSVEPGLAFDSSSLVRSGSSWLRDSAHSSVVLAIFVPSRPHGDCAGRRIGLCRVPV